MNLLIALDKFRHDILKFSTDFGQLHGDRHIEEAVQLLLQIVALFHALVSSDAPSAPARRYQTVETRNVHRSLSGRGGGRSLPSSGRHGFATAM